MIRVIDGHKEASLRTALLWGELGEKHLGERSRRQVSGSGETFPPKRR